jgi:hypothetical protein
MPQISVNIPDSLYTHARELAQREHTSIHQFIITAVAEKISVSDAEAFFRERAQKGRRAAFLEIMDRVPDVPPIPGDELPNDVP